MLRRILERRWRKCAGLVGVAEVPVRVARLRPGNELWGVTAAMESFKKF